MTAYDAAFLALTGVQGYWPLDDTVGATSFRDASGGPIGPFPTSGFWGTSGNPSILPGDASTCAHKTGGGSDQIALAGAALAAVQQAGPLSVVAWVQPDTFTVADAGYRQFILGQFGSWDIQFTRQGLVLAMANVGNATSGESAVVNNPVMLAGVYDRSNGKAYTYINGVQQSPLSSSNPITAATTNLELGGIVNGIPFKGYMQKVGFTSSALTPSQAQSLAILGFQTASEVAGQTLNVMPFSRQLIAAGARNSLRITNTSDTPMYLKLGTSPAVVQQGPCINPGGHWPQYEASTWTGAVQIIHSNWLGAKVAVIETT